MSQKGDSKKVSTERKDAITVILTANTYHDRIEDAELVMGSKYGRIADVIPYVEPKPIPAQYLPALAAAGDFPLSDALKEKLKERALNRYQTRLDEAAKNKIKMYFDLFGYFSAESLILVKRHPNYLVECGQNRDADRCPSSDCSERTSQRDRRTHHFEKAFCEGLERYRVRAFKNDVRNGSSKLL